MHRNLVIFSHSADFTTGRYFERAARRSGKWADVRYVSRAREIGVVDARSVLFLVDPPEDWLLGWENLPCLKIAYLIDVHLNYAYRTNLGAWCDLVIVAQRQFVKDLQSDGHRHVHWLPLAADPDVHFVSRLERKYDLGFVGKMGATNSRRFQILTQVLSQFDTNDYRRWYAPNEMGRIYSQSKIVVNASINNDVNMRVFEALAAGALLVTDYPINGLDELLVEGREYVGYSTAAEAIDKIQYYLAHCAERAAIAQAGQNAVLATHTYAHRMQQIEDLLSAGEWRGSALVNQYSRSELADAHARMFVALRKPFGILSVMGRYGVSVPVAHRFLHSSGAWLNQRVPITPNAIRAKRLAGDR
jgi:hypothetical protein